ncbi:unnamed protein product [Moneuplotes crassus]|uniref:Metallo-beta-lactamase domain-containing protein n=1 Tax=Euplotes crassus TaxID=5936 RepID=A0AAD1XJ18_EUPCR|nr:unnamed protein product [Moneuplotes crassus]
MEGIDPKFLDAPPVQVTDQIIRFHGLNPGGHRINGNNNFLVGTGKSRILIDCGACEGNQEQSEKFVKSLIDYLQEHELTLSHILITHYHHDHLGNVPGVLSSLKDLGHNTEEIIVAKRLYKGAHVEDTMEIIKDKCVTKDLEDDEIIENETSKIQCLFTPGHCEDHMCYLLYPQSEDESYVIFSGDCVLGTPSGKFEELYDYMKSLYRIQSLCEKYPNLQICFGHSIDLEKEYIIMDAKSKIDDYIATRLEREEQIISKLLLTFRCYKICCFCGI